jgi:hypothetical protein
VNDDGRPIPDGGVELDGGYGLAWCVAADGSRWPWLISPHCSCDGYVGCMCRNCAPHEQAGGLPRKVREAIGLVCGRPSRKGQPCRNLVPRLGDACKVHRFTVEPQQFFEERPRD